MAGVTPEKKSKDNGRTKTGITGLDELLQGGIPKGNLVLLSGSCGTGKSTFGMQYIYNGAAQFNEPGIYLTFEEQPEKLLKEMANFGWDIKSQMKKKKISFIAPEIYKFDELRREIGDEIDRIGAKRLVVDSFTLLSSYLKSDYEARRALTQLDKEIKKFDCTSLAISDIKEGSNTFSVTGYEEFIVDGVIVLRLTSSNPGGVGAYTRSVFIRKMRGTGHSLEAVPMNFEEKGLEVYPSAKVF